MRGDAKAWAGRPRGDDADPDESLLASDAPRCGQGPARWLDGAALHGPSQFQFWLIALLIGIAAGFAALLFRKGIDALQKLAYGVEDVARIHSLAEQLPWYWILLLPAAGGLVVGIILHRFTPTGACGRWPT